MRRSRKSSKRNTAAEGVPSESGDEEYATSSSGASLTNGATGGVSGGDHANSCCGALLLLDMWPRRGQWWDLTPPRLGCHRRSTDRIVAFAARPATTRTAVGSRHLVWAATFGHGMGVRCIGIAGAGACIETLKRGLSRALARRRGSWWGLTWASTLLDAFHGGFTVGIRG